MNQVSSPLHPGQFPEDEIRELTAYMDGMADGTDNYKIARVAYWLDRFADHICAGGIIGCRSGKKCTSDHK